MPRSVRAVDALAVVAFLFGSHPVAAQEPAAYVAKPEFVLDGSRHKLSGSYWLGVRSDGSLVSEPIGNQNVEFLAASGERLSFAQPGASAAVVAAGFIGDTVWGRDPSSSTVTLISPELKVVRTISVPSAVTLPSGDVVQFGSMMGANPLLPVAIEPDGSFLVSTFGGRVPVAWHRPPGAATSVLHISAQGLFRALIGWTNITDSTCNATMGVFCGRAPMAIASDGHAVAFVHPSVAGADSGTFTVAVIKPTGDTVYARRYPFVARPASRHDVDSVVDGIASRMRSPNPVWIARVKAAIHPTIFPPIVSVLFAEDGDLWIEQPPVRGMTEWLVLDSTGTPARVVKVPAGIHIQAVRGDVAWGGRRDSPNTVSLVRLRITPFDQH